MEFFAKIVNGFWQLTIFAKSSIVDDQLGCKYTSIVDLLEVRKFIETIPSTKILITKT